MSHCYVLELHQSTIVAQTKESVLFQGGLLAVLCPALKAIVKVFVLAVWLVPSVSQRNCHIVPLQGVLRSSSAVNVVHCKSMI